MLLRYISKKEYVDTETVLAMIYISDSWKEQSCHISMDGEILVRHSDEFNCPFAKRLRHGP